MNRSFLLIPLIFLVIIILVELFIYFGKAGVSKSTTEQISISPTKIVNPDSNNVVLPSININNQAVRSTYITYVIRVVINDIKKDSKGQELVTDFKDDEIPTFIVEKSTKITLSSNGKKMTSNLNALKKGQNIDLNVSFNFKKKTWNLYSVNILEDKNASPSSSIK
ncbi:MAG: hypothetical protein HYW86_00265 [Candidatus Roizmanbacteria bacterium]|nr:MAG: hypothetical protein HYW86_00265 [Candidatus Roizmanbacteria bacterium]